MGQESIAIVSFAEQSRCDAVRTQLARLGYSTTPLPEEIENASQFEDFEGILVCVLGRRRNSEETVFKFVSKTKKMRRLAILTDQNKEWNREIVRSFNDFSNWPCSDEELTLRLDRLRETSYDRPDVADEQFRTEELIALNFIGRSPAFKGAIRLIRIFALHDAAVLIEGETGTGKELAAQAIHYSGNRKQFPFICVNCGSIPDGLVENELFGHERGAYTDAKESSSGIVAQAHNGTLLLDEIEALSPKAQASLLRFLQDHEFRPIGGKRTISVNVRIIAASNASLHDLVKRGEFRQDLLFRLNVLYLKIPPLRQRPEDIELLAEHFLKSYQDRYDQPDKYLPPASIEWAKKYDWPGNVREMENLIHRAFLLAEGASVRLDQSADNDRSSSEDFLPLNPVDDVSVITFNKAKARMIEEFEKNYLSKLMAEAKGNVTLAAKYADKERRTLGKLLKKYGIDKKDFLSSR